MHIALVAESMDRMRVGAIFSLNRYVTWLRERGIKITIVTTGTPGEGKIILDAFYPWYMKNAFKETDFVFASPDRTILTNVFSNADVVHVAFPFQLGKAAVSLARKMNKPLLASFHVQPENLLYAINAEKIILLRLIMYKMFIASYFNKADLVHCPSSFAADELAGNGCRRPMKVISNGIPTNIKPIRIPKPAEYKDYFIIFCHGRFAREKRQCDLIDAVAQSHYKDRIKLIISGMGPTESALREQAAKVCNDAVITYLSDEELVRHLQFSDIFVHSSLIDLESLSCLEAIGSGMVPLIAKAKASASTQFALDDRSIFPVGDIATLTKKIDYWFENREELQKMNAKYIEFSKQFSADKITDEVISVYEQLLRKRN